ncbi:MAG TPA: four helix bundle protein [Gemmatimonadaceae bacterium]|nr:four helix bundle protein [Gemmatimonadaceae bacterium]
MPSRSDALHKRLKAFGIAANDVVRRVPRDAGGQNAARQLAKCSTSPAAHYSEARAAESTRDYIHKMRTCLKELREADYWLEFVQATSRNGLKTDALRMECGELIAIVWTCIKKAGGDPMADL